MLRLVLGFPAIEDASLDEAIEAGGGRVWGVGCRVWGIGGILNNQSTELLGEKRLSTRPAQHRSQHRMGIAYMLTQALLKGFDLMLLEAIKGDRAAHVKGGAALVLDQVGRGRDAQERKRKAMVSRLIGAFVVAVAHQRKKIIN